LREEPLHDDAEIHHAIDTLGTLIDGYVLRHYSPNVGRRTSIHRRIGENIIEKIIKGCLNETTVADHISRDLKRYTENPTKGDPDKELVDLCQKARCIKEMVQRHPSRWEFGDWDVAGLRVEFPSVLKDGKEVMRAWYKDCLLV